MIFDIAQKIEADKGFDGLSDIQDNFHEINANLNELTKYTIYDYDGDCQFIIIIILMILLVIYVRDTSNCDTNNKSHRVSKFVSVNQES